jgi:hypothetical protein
MAQVGQTTPSGGREWSIGTNLGACRRVVVPVNCTLNHIGVWVREQTTPNTNNIRAAIYNNSGILQFQTSILTADIDATTFDLYQLPFSGQSLAAGTYILALGSSSATGAVIMQGQNDSSGLPTYMNPDEPESLHPTFPSDASLFTRTDAARQWDMYLDYTEATGVTVTSVTPSTMRGGQVGVAIVGTGFGASQGGGFVRICPTDDVDDVNGINQTITAWGDTGVTFNVVAGNLSLTSGLYLFVRNDSSSANTAGFAVQFDPALALVALGAGLID